MASRGDPYDRLRAVGEAIDETERSVEEQRAEQDAELAALAELGVPIARLAEELGVTRKTIYKRLQRHRERVERAG